MNELDLWRKTLVQQLESLQRAGVTHLPRVSVVAPAAPPAQSSPSTAPASRANPPTGQAESPAAPAASAKNSDLPRRRAAVPPTAPPDPARSAPALGSPPLVRAGASLPLTQPLPLAQRQAAFDALCGEVRACRKCPVLVANRTQTVFGVGNLQPRLCFFGEAPGADEDEQGEPFVGKAGQLLNRMITAMTLRREDVYILNVLKCRPPDNRPPLPEEAEKCRPFFERQLQVLQPEFICCLGASAAQALLQTKFSIGKLRGRFYEYGSAKVLATYHPSYVLRSPSAKKPVWEDLQKLMAEMGLKLPK